MLFHAYVGSDNVWMLFFDLDQCCVIPLTEKQPHPSNSTSSGSPSFLCHWVFLFCARWLAWHFGGFSVPRHSQSDRSTGWHLEWPCSLAQRWATIGSSETRFLRESRLSRWELSWQFFSRNIIQEASYYNSYLTSNYTEQISNDARV